MIPPILCEIAESITADCPELPSGGGDGRLDSGSAESKIISFLQNQDQNQNRWKIYSPNIGSTNNRSWYDMRVGDNGFFCDIKVSKLRGRDNTNAKKAIFYFLTGKDPTCVSDQNQKFFQDMSESEQADESRDFYFIIVDKSSVEAFVVSLKCIAEVHPAHNNLPFQCKWIDCREPVARNWTEGRNYLLGSWAESIKRGMQAYKNGMPAFYPDFFNTVHE